MFTGAHFLFYSKNPEADRAFFRDILSLRSIEMGEGWLIFAMPSSEAAIHPMQEELSQKHGGQDLLGAVLYLMCDDLGWLHEPPEGERNPMHRDPVRPLGDIDYYSVAQRSAYRTLPAVPSNRSQPALLNS